MVPVRCTRLYTTHARLFRIPSRSTVRLRLSRGCLAPGLEHGHAPAGYCAEKWSCASSVARSVLIRKHQRTTRERSRVLLDSLQCQQWASTACHAFGEWARYPLHDAPQVARSEHVGQWCSVLLATPLVQLRNALIGFRQIFTGRPFIM